MGGTLTVANSTFSANQAGYGGGGIANWDTSILTTTAALMVVNSTLSSNQANSGGGIYNAYTTTLTLKNTVIANSVSSGDCVNVSGGRVDPSSMNNLIKDSANACGLVNGVNGNIIGADPRLVR